VAANDNDAEEPAAQTEQQTMQQAGVKPGELPEKSGLPTELPVIARSGRVLFPGIVVPIHVQEETNLEAIESAIHGDKTFLSLNVTEQEEEERPDEREGDTAQAADSQMEESEQQEEADNQEGEDWNPDPEDLYTVGTACTILQMLRMPDGTIQFLAQGVSRSNVTEFTQTDPFLLAQVEHLKEERPDDTETRALFQNLQNQFLQMADSVPYLGDDLKVAVSNIENAGRLADMVAFNLNLSNPERQNLLETLNIKERLRKLTKLVAREKQYMETARKIQSEAEEEMSQAQREYYLRKQLEAIREELGESDPQTAEIEELRQQLEEKEMPEQAEDEARRELTRLERINPASPEYNVARTYLDWTLSLPWCESTDDNLDLEQAQDILEEDHYGLEDIKERVLEFLAVRKLKGDMGGSILCFIGPPGTGKTSIGQSIARALGRKYHRLSLGGVRDEAEIRGHRRTYIGSRPGRIISALHKVQSNNPVLMLDEIDKVGADFRGDPTSALLEVLDPEQNDNFTDHYLEVPFDLSKVLFIATGNILDTVPPALQDRMEVLEFSGYTEEEKLNIAKQYLVPQQIDQHGLSEDTFQTDDEAIRKLIQEYTEEAGVRNLERQIASLCRKTAKEVTMGGEESTQIDAEKVRDLLGPAKFIPDVAERVDEPGVACGLAWTPNGGRIIFVEATRTPGDGELILTGSLGDVMKESARAALTHVRSHSSEFDIEGDPFEDSDFHIHVPAGAIKKDGPSAGVAVATALVSLCRDKPVEHTVAMSGEVTLRGKVLPVGGIKDKVLAALRAGIETVVLPKRNEKDMEEVPDYAKNHIDFRFVEKVDQIMPVAFDEEDEATDEAEEDSGSEDEEKVHAET